MFGSIITALLLLGAAALWPAAAQAGECDLSAEGAFCPLNGIDLLQPIPLKSGSTDRVIVRIGDGDADTAAEVQGFNTSGRPVQFDEMTNSQYTPDLLVGDLKPIAGTEGLDRVFDYVFKLSVNESENDPLLSLDQLKIFASNTGGLTSYPNLGTLIYDMDADGDNWVRIDNNVIGASGDFDLFFYLRTSLLDGYSHLYLFSQFGSHYANDGGYEEWVAVVPEPSMAWLLAAGLLVVALQRMRDLHRESVRRVHPNLRAPRSSRSRLL